MNLTSANFEKIYIMRKMHLNPMKEGLAITENIKSVIF